MTTRTKNEYAELRAVLAELDDVRADHNRRASLNIGVISGGVDVSDSGKTIDRLVIRAEGIVGREIARGCRLSHLRNIVRDYGGSRSINDLISEAEIDAEISREAAAR